MNLRSLVRGAVNKVNRDRQIQWYQYQTYTTDSSGKSTPVYAAAQTIWGQIQPLPTDRLAHLENLNIQGILRQVYLRGAIASAVREDGTGGDLLQFPETGPAWTAGSDVVTAGSQSSTAGQPAFKTWLVVLVDEQWGDKWCRVTVRMQNFPVPS